MQPNYSPNISILTKAAFKAARAMRRDYNEVENLQFSQKGTSSFVSTTDKKVEKIIFETLSKDRPAYGFLFEEAGVIEGENKNYRFIVDPLDGTHNFMHSYPIFAISIAIEKTTQEGTKEIIACVTLDPQRRELFWAEKNKGAWLEDEGGRGQRLRVAARKKLSESMVCFSSARSNNVNTLAKISPKVRCARITGSAALNLAYIAAGRSDCFLDEGAEPWDLASGILLVSEAGGKITNFTGNIGNAEQKSTIACNEDLHKVMSKELA